MKSLKLFLIVSMMLMMIVPVAMAAEKCSGDCSGCGEETDIKVFGSARYRLEMDGKSFVKDSPLDWTQYMRSRLGVKASRGNTGMVFEVQDSRVLGDTPGTFDFTNGGRHTYMSYPTEYDKTMPPGFRNDFGVRQAYIWHKPCDKGGFKLGRFGVNMHNQRLIGEVNWSNIGRTFEGLLFKRELTESVNITGAALQVQELNRYAAADNDFYDAGDKIMDEMFYVFNVNFPEQMVDLFFYYWNHPDQATQWKHMTFGAFSKREFGSNMFYEAMFAMQSGTEEMMDTATKATSTTDYSGMLVNAEIGMKLDGGTKISALFDYTTGDDPDTPEYEAFNNLFYTGHKWNGAMDFFVFGDGFAGGGNGLTDIGLRVAHPINETTWVKVCAHMFAATQEYADGKSSFGNEVDIALMRKAGDMKITGGLSFFMASEDWAGADAATAKWAFVQTAFGF